MTNDILSNVLGFFRDDDLNIRGLSEKQWESIIRVAREAGVLGRIFQIISDKDQVRYVQPFALKHLQAATAYSVKQAQQVKFEAEGLIRLLKRAGIDRHMFLKGSAYVLSHSPVASGRTFSDIDMLVDKSHIEAAENKLMLYGWFQDETSDYDQRYYRLWSHEIPPLRHSARGTVLDLHHNLLPPITGRAPEVAMFWQNTVNLSDGETVLSPAAMTMHSTIHLFFQEDFSHGFRDLTDLHILMTHHNEEAYWRSLVSLAEKSGFGRELFLAIRYCQRILKTTIPSSVLADLEVFRPGRIRLKYLDWMFEHVLIPQHSLINTRSTALANASAFVRGHLIKMPLHILVYHTVHKAVVGINFLITGRKDSKQDLNNKSEQ